MECIFCGIVSREIPATVVAEDEQIMAFPDIHPKAPVHIIVIPKQHIESIAHLGADHSDVIAAIIYAAKRIAAEKHLEGYKLVFNVGRLGGQSVDHLHLHLLGGWTQPDDWKKGFPVE
ncbi:MAG: histidine triad nucleotide-binding protein [Candidatus Sungbacteria bacterium RIFCSPLOWO2_01_FULL_59_16]|uniref:Histidine triad nucleotide-binding protein n=1 Tax=Candidatus Sungbacteria bacterium RIFCSPLOWO2_01_FULL_59_16 TaxID=1802280 RepID=A0A1G2L9A5_9BACT|nr:MAG: histidine triad nucleotide-binding protein [Candidatus Sungbacteria bacterium RIFCSPLOWO2_01_FULL_59_16]